MSRRGYVVRLIACESTGFRHTSDTYMLSSDVDYSPADVTTMSGLILETRDLQEAHVFPTLADAKNWYFSRGVRVPRLPDGSLNMPFRAWTVELVPVTIEAAA